MQSIEQAAKEYADSLKLDDAHRISKQQFEEYAQDDFKAGVEFAESKFQEAFTEIIIENQGLKLYKDNEAKRFEELAIEFADWINVSKQGFHSLYREKNSTTPIYWAEALVGGKIDYTSKDLYQQFIKDRDAV